MTPSLPPELAALAARFDVLRGTSPQPERQIVSDLLTLTERYAREREEALTAGGGFAALAAERLAERDQLQQENARLREELAHFKAPNAVPDETWQESLDRALFEYEWERSARIQLQRDCERLTAFKEHAEKHMEREEKLLDRVREENSRLTARVASLEEVERRWDQLIGDKFDEDDVEVVDMLDQLGRDALIKKLVKENRELRGKR